MPTKKWLEFQEKIKAHGGDSDAVQAPRKKRSRKNNIRELWEAAFNPQPKRDWLLPLKYIGDIFPRRGQQRLFE